MTLTPSMRRPRRKPPLSRSPRPRSHNSASVSSHKLLRQFKCRDGKISSRILRRIENGMHGLQQKGDVLVGSPEHLGMLARPLPVVARQPVDGVIEAGSPGAEGGHDAALPVLRAMLL